MTITLHVFPLTVADLSLAATFASADEARFPLAGFANIQRWLAEMQALPAWARTKALQKPQI
jgi:glutathione S-transferase